MPAFICTTCGCQYPNTEAPPAGCLICKDDRQSVGPGLDHAAGDALEPWPFETIYGGWWDRVIPQRAKMMMTASVEQYVEAVTGSLEIFESAIV
ncbi:MAG TPA: hypothetical protein DDZ81_26205 [Acetobacteraceae bacterium]|jgi:hypothetical protein|nr:hypothetical protein [Acetobacteraceae bacterium]